MMDSDSKMREVIATVVRRIVAEYAPQKVILFGSYARGNPHPDSDIDLLIIKETSERFLDRLDRVRQAAEGAHPGVPFEPIVLTPHEVEEGLRAGNGFVAEIVEKGEVLYAA